MDDIARYVLHLHERYDGTGYPDGPGGEDIPLESRILHVADALEAMTSSRVYRDALPLEEALERARATAPAPSSTPRCVAKMAELVRSGEIKVVSEDEIVHEEGVTAEAVVPNGLGGERPTARQRRRPVGSERRRSADAEDLADADLGP